MLKSTFSGIQCCRWQYGSIFIRLAVIGSSPKSAKSHEILRKFVLIALQGHPRSSILVPIEIASTTSYISFYCICFIVFVSVCQSVFVCNYTVTVRTASMWRINFITNINFVRIFYRFRDWRILLESSLFSPPHPCLTPFSGGTPCPINVVYTPLESIFNGLQLCRWHCGSIFIRLAVVASQSREIARNSDKIFVQFESADDIFSVKAKNRWIFPTDPCLRLGLCSWEHLNDRWDDRDVTPLSDRDQGPLFIRPLPLSICY